MDRNEPSNDAELDIPFMEQGSNQTTRLPFADRLNPRVRNHTVACMGEFIGTFFFLFFGLSGAEVANSITGYSDPVARVMYISLSFGFSLAVNVWVMYRVSGGLFNPAVTVGMCLVSAIPWERGSLLIVTQLLSAIVASLFVKAIFPGPMALTKLNALANIQSGQGFLIELFLTYQFVLSIMMMAGEKNAATHLAPVGIGLALFVAELSGVHFTGGSLNPARSFGPAVAMGDFTGGHWVYWLGPLGGALMAAGTYKLLKILEYEKANPGQDGHHHQPAKTGQVRI